MLSLTTWQRDMLQYLINTDVPVDAAALGQQLDLTPNQIRYSLRDIKSWLNRRQATLYNTPRVGLQVICTPEQRQAMLAELSSQFKFQLILSPDQRQQLIGLVLLAAESPITLSQLQDDLTVARMTVLKDLESLESWLLRFDLQIARRQHRGLWVDGDEFARRQTLTALLWGDDYFDRPIMAVHPARGFVFALAQDNAFLPIIGHINALLREWNLSEAQQYIAVAERELGARFTDSAVVLLTLAVAIQIQRIRIGQQIMFGAETLRWVQSQGVWPVAKRIYAEFGPNLTEEDSTAEAAAFALHLLSGARDEPWRQKLGGDHTFPDLIHPLMQSIAAAFGLPALALDPLLYDGLNAIIMPACVRQRFKVWTPHKTTNDIRTDDYTRERTIAAQIAAEVQLVTDMVLPNDAIDDVVLLLRAAVVRAQPDRVLRILVVCPSGMATTQLLVAQLKSRFLPRGTFEALSMRELNAERIANADLLITTVPLSLPDNLPIAVIRVHPMLNSEDIATLTQWLA